MKNILLTLALILSTTGCAASETLDKERQFRQQTMRDVFKIYSHCITVASNLDRIKETQKLFKSKNVFLTQDESKKFTFAFCMSGRYDIRLNNVTIKFLNMKKEF